MSISPSSPSAGNGHLLPRDLDAMLVAAVREEIELPDREVADLTDRIRALARPAWLLGPGHDAQDPPAVGGSRIGGLPDLPEDMSWPTVRVAPGEEVALAFTAQIDLAEVPGAADAGWLPATGRLWFFFDEDRTGVEPDHVVLYSDAPPERLRPTRPPAGLRCLNEADTGPDLDRPVPVRPHRSVFLIGNHQTGWHGEAYERLAEELDERLGEDGIGFELLYDVQRRLRHAAVGDRRWDAMLVGRPTPCPPPGGFCPCGRFAPGDTPGYDTVEGPCAWAKEALLVLYDLWGDGPLVFTADATIPPPAGEGRWSGTEAWVY